MARWDSCNILQTGPTSRVWQFNKNLSVHRDQTLTPGAPLPENIVGKGWSSLWKKKLNVAWLPPEHVFIRVAQLPASTPEETRTMVELQLEKLSPIPVTQAVWSMHVVGKSAQGLQTIIVLIAERTMVEGFLGKLEEQGFLADRLELPMLDQLQATVPDSDGAWIYPAASDGRGSALVAWWYGGTLQSVSLIVSPSNGADRAAGLRDQLVQMAWAGELEGWLTAPPSWNLVADDQTAAEWEPILREGLSSPIKRIAPISGVELAARTARRIAEGDGEVNLLPPEFAKRYRQQFVDYLWGRSLLIVLGIYVAAALVVFVAIQVRRIQAGRVENRVASLGVNYTNALQTIARYTVLKNREALKFAGLDCYEAVAETQPSGVTLENFNFNDGKRLTLSGIAPASQVTDVIDFTSKVKKSTRPDGKPLFDALAPDSFNNTIVNGVARWSFTLQLKDQGGSR
jgi:hypothetical protein